MRGLILTKTGNYYVTSDRPDWADEDKDCVVATLATGGEISVHYTNIEVCEWYPEEKIGTFRLRLHELRSQKG